MAGVGRPSSSCNVAPRTPFLGLPSRNRVVWQPMPASFVRFASPRVRPQAALCDIPKHPEPLCSWDMILTWFVGRRLGTFTSTGHRTCTMPILGRPSCVAMGCTCCWMQMGPSWSGHSAEVFDSAASLVTASSPTTALKGSERSRQQQCSEP